MAVEISQELRGRIEAKVTSGLYESPGDVIREALRLLDQRDEVKRKIADGAASLRRGEGVDAEEVFLQLERELDSIDRSRRGQ